MFEVWGFFALVPQVSKNLAPVLIVWTGQLQPLQLFRICEFIYLCYPKGSIQSVFLDQIATTTFLLKADQRAASLILKVT